MYADEQFHYKKVHKYGHILNDTTLIWSNGHDDVADLVFIITFVISIYDGGSILHLCYGSFKVLIHDIIGNLFFPFVIWLTSGFYLTVFTKAPLTSILIVHIFVRGLIFL